MFAKKNSVIPALKQNKTTTCFDFLFNAVLFLLQGNIIHALRRNLHGQFGNPVMNYQRWDDDIDFDDYEVHVYLLQPNFIHEMAYLNSKIKIRIQILYLGKSHK